MPRATSRALLTVCKDGHHFHELWWLLRAQLVRLQANFGEGVRRLWSAGIFYAQLSRRQLLRRVGQRPPQPFSFAVETLQLHLGAMMHIDTNACGKKLMAATPAHDVHPLLDSPEFISYWPYADAIAVKDKTGAVSEIPRVQQWMNDEVY